MPSTNFRHGIASCPGCATQLIAPFEVAGRVVRCKSCGTRFALPEESELFESAVAFMLDYERELDEHDDLDAVAPQVQRDTMVRDQPAANTDPAWLD